MGLTLVFDFSFSDVFSVSVANDDGLMFFSGFSGGLEGFGSRAIASAIDMVISVAGVKPEEVEKIVMTRGPGSFTALRCALAYAKGMSVALSLPVEVYCSFDWIPLYLCSVSKVNYFNDELVVAAPTGVKGVIYIAKYKLENSIPKQETLRTISENDILELECKTFHIKDIPLELGAKYLVELNKKLKGMFFPPDKIDELEPIYLFPTNFKKSNIPLSF